MSDRTVTITETHLEDIADAIRDKLNVETTYTPGQMAEAIESIPEGGVVDVKSITANGVYDAGDDNLDGYSVVTVAVPNTYAAGDEGKVVSNGDLVSQSQKSITANGTYDTTTNNSAVVAVPNTYVAGDEGKVVSNGDLVSQTARSSAITINGTYDTTLNNSVTVSVEGGGGGATLITKSVTANGTYQASGDNADGYSSVTVAVPNTYSAGDEGKVVSSGALVAQTARSSPITEDGTYDTTNNNSVTVSFPVATTAEVLAYLGISA